MGINVNDLINTANAAANMARQAAQNAATAYNAVGALQKQVQEAKAMLQMLAGMGRPDLARIYNEFSGNYIPYDLCVKIPISSTMTDPQTGQHTLSADGPFVAVKRYAVFLSSYQFQVTDQGSVSTFNGRSFGRFRPISSMNDLCDAMTGFSAAIGAAAPGTGLFSLVSSNQHSPFRTMEFDGLIEVESGSGLKRQNDAVPSALWAPGFNSSEQLPVVDLILPGDTVYFKVQPQHVNNPAAGNIQSLVGSLPYLGSQYDAHEGITYTAAVQGGTDDSITRQADGILYIGFLGFKVLKAR